MEIINNKTSSFQNLFFEIRLANTPFNVTKGSFKLRIFQDGRFSPKNDDF